MWRQFHRHSERVHLGRIWADHWNLAEKVENSQSFICDLPNKQKSCVSHYPQFRPTCFWRLSGSTEMTSSLRPSAASTSVFLKPPQNIKSTVKDCQGKTSFEAWRAVWKIFKLTTWIFIRWKICSSVCLPDCLIFCKNSECYGSSHCWYTDKYTNVLDPIYYRYTLLIAGRLSRKRWWRWRTWWGAARCAMSVPAITWVTSCRKLSTSPNTWASHRGWHCRWACMVCPKRETSGDVFVRRQTFQSLFSWLLFACVLTGSVLTETQKAQDFWVGYLIFKSRAPPARHSEAVWVTMPLSSSGVVDGGAGNPPPLKWVMQF